MKSIRLVVALLAIALAFPAAVLLRSGVAHAANSEAVEVCNAWEHIVRQIAAARDSGQTIGSTVEVLDRHVAEGRVPAEAYPMVVKMIVFVFSQPGMSADQLAKKVKSDCFAAYGVKGA